MVNSINAVQREAILQIRHQLLSSDVRIEEMSRSSSIFYGKGKKLCAELRARVSCGQQEDICLFLWLLHVDNKLKVYRMWMWLIHDWAVVHHFGNYPHAFKRPRQGSCTWYVPGFLHHMQSFGYKNSIKAYQILLECPEEDWTKPEAYVDLATSTWQKQLSGVS